MRQSNSLKFINNMALTLHVSDFKKLRRAGILKNKFFTEKEVPLGTTAGSCDTNLLPSIINMTT